MKAVWIALTLLALGCDTKRAQVISLGPVHDASSAADGNAGSGGSAEEVGSGGGGSGGTPGTGGADADTAAEVAIEAAVTPDATGDGQACSTLANTAPAVPVTTGDDTVATGAGGTVAAGTYYLTAIVRTPASVLPQMTFRQTLRITGNTVEMAADDSDKPAFTKTSTFTTSGSSIVFTRLCSTEADSLTELQYESYTANDAHLILYGVTLGITVTYTRQG
jgi:hypothetical protein